MKIFISIFIFAILAGSGLKVEAQGRDNQSPFDRSAYFGGGSKFFSEVVILPGATQDSAKVLLLLKISKKSIYFVQINNGSDYGKFIGLPQIEIVFKDDVGIIRNRVLWRDTVLEKTYDATNEKDYFFGYAETMIQKGKYDVSFELYGQYGKTEDKREIKIDAYASSVSGEYKPAPICFIDKKESGYIYEPNILNGGMPFSPDGVFFLMPFSSSAKTFKYQLKKANSELKEDKWFLDVNLTGQCEVIEGGELKLSELDKRKGIKLKMINAGTGAQSGYTESRTGFLKISVAPKWIAPGKYELSIVSDNKKDTAKYSISCIWPDEPRSFMTVKYASDALSYVVPEEKLDKIKSGSDNEIYKNIIEFWKKQDPTPETAYNEALNEYYKRIDYAFYNYQTIKDRDGAKTDRGFVYIIYGLPDRVDTSVKNGRVVETWVYDKLLKEFTFEAISPGTYKLMAIKQ